MAANPQTKPTDLGCESAERLAATVRKFSSFRCVCFFGVRRFMRLHCSSSATSENVNATSVAISRSLAVLRTTSCPVACVCNLCRREFIVRPILHALSLHALYTLALFTCRFHYLRNPYLQNDNYPQFHYTRIKSSRLNYFTVVDESLITQQVVGVNRHHR